MKDDREMLEGLLKRVKVATGPDRQLDGDLWQALTGDRVIMMPLTGPKLHANGEDVPRLTASIDADVALVERCLPGWAWRIGTCHVSDDAWLAPDFNDPIHGNRLKAEIPNLIAGSVFDIGVDIDRRPPGNVALALIEALLAALFAKSQTEQT